MRKTRRCPCVKGFGRFRYGRSDERCRAPKAGALPTALHPVISLFYPAARIHPTKRDTNFATPGDSIFAIIPQCGEKSKIFLSVVNSVVKAAFVPLSATGGNPANAGVARLSGLLLKRLMDRVCALPKRGGQSWLVRTAAGRGERTRGAGEQGAKQKRPGPGGSGPGRSLTYYSCFGVGMQGNSSAGLRGGRRA